MKLKKWAVVLLAVSFLLSCFGCGKKHVMDGPGMVNDQPWKGFSLSRSDSYAQHDFRFEVHRNEFGYVLTGECRDKDGEAYVLTSEDGVELSADDLQFLRSLWLGELPDATSFEAKEDLLLTDAPEVSFVLTWLDNTQQEKVLPNDVSIEIYEHFLPYFENQ